MARKRIMIKTKSPVSITARKPYGQFYETLDYIPAKTLRGAFAQSLLDRCKLAESNPQKRGKCDECPSEIAEECDFYNMFKKRELIKFGDCYAVHSDPGEKSNAHFLIPRILPATAVSCKYHSGFSTGYEYYLYFEFIEAQEVPPHGVFDLLVKHIVYDELKEPKYVYKPECPKCGGIVEPFGGHYQLFVRNGGSEDEENIYFRYEAKKRRFGRSATNRKTWASQEGMLYSVQAIAENSVFLGEIEVDDGNDELLDNAIDSLENLDNVGGQSSRGLGHVKIELYDYKPNTSSIRCRIKKLNELIDRERGCSSGKVYFTIDFQSDAILRGMLDEPILQLDENLLKRYLRHVDDDFDSECFDEHGVKLERAYSTGTYIGGWSTAWKLPKYIQLAIAKGSVFLFSTSEIDDDFCHSLEKLEQKGVGEKLEEGFGKISVCEQFHMEVEPK